MDIDPQAVEVTKLSLLLKVLEGERRADHRPAARALPRACAARPGPQHQVRQLADRAGFLRQATADGAAGRRGSASASTSSTGRPSSRRCLRTAASTSIIGNPPYIRIQALKEWAPLEVEYYKRRYRAASKGNYDIYVVFVEKALSLLNEHGRLGFILPHKFFNAQYGEPLRGLIAEGQHLADVVHFGDQQVFAGATTYTCLLFLEKAGAQVVQLRQGARFGRVAAGGAADGAMRVRGRARDTRPSGTSPSARARRCSRSCGPCR